MAAVGVYAVPLLGAESNIASVDGTVVLAKASGYNYAVVAIANDEIMRQAAALTGTSEQRKNWCSDDTPVLSHFQLQTSNNRDFIVGSTSRWIHLDTHSPDLNLSNEHALGRQVTWAEYLGISAVLFDTNAEYFTGSKTITNLARCISTLLASTQLNIWLRIPFAIDGSPQAAWQLWRRIKTFCGNAPTLHAVLDMAVGFDSDAEAASRVPAITGPWAAEPVKALFLPASVFVTNAKGYPVMNRLLQGIVRDFCRYNVQCIVQGIDAGLHAAGGPAAYAQYIQHLYKTRPQNNAAHDFTSGYEDYLQAPLQPLMDNLESSTYEIFETDPVKYQQYEKAIYHALLDIVPIDRAATQVVVIMVVGAGRGPLVNCSLRAAHDAGRLVKVYAVEKNQNACIS